MKYMTDANISGLANELKDQGIDCQTVYEIMMNKNDTRVQIKDPEIVKFLHGQNKKMTLITLATELAEYCPSFRRSLHKGPRPRCRPYQEDERLERHGPSSFALVSKQ